MHKSPINPRIMKPVRFGAERIYLDIHTINLFFGGDDGHDDVGNQKSAMQGKETKHE
jgi:hypothetical protein